MIMENTIPDSAREADAAVVARLPERLAAFRAEIAALCAECGREASSVKLVPATKTHGAAVVNALYALGVESAGENKVQEFVEKYPDADARIGWHFIGRLQTNKVKYIADKVRMIESLDRIELAREIEKQSARHCRVTDCLVEINIARNPAHGGVAPEDAELFVGQLQEYGHIRICGIMGVLPPAETPEETALCEECAREMHNLSETLAERYPDMVELSMGMSGDYAIAVRYGATILRPGRVLFGARDYR